MSLVKSLQTARSTLLKRLTLSWLSSLAGSILSCSDFGFISQSSVVQLDTTLTSMPN